MRQWLNLIAVVVGALLLGATLLIAVQTPVPPGDDRAPAEASVPAVVAASPTPPPRMPDNRAGLVLAVADDGALHVFSADGTQRWPLLPEVKAADAAWSPDGRHVVVATADRKLLVTHPERGDARMLLPDDQSLAAAPLSWSDAITVAFTVQRQDGPSAAVWSYRSGAYQLLGPGNGAVASPATGAVAWSSPDERAIMLQPPDSTPTMLVRQQALYELVAKHSASLGLVGQPQSPPMRWSPDGSRLAFPVAVVPSNMQIDWLVVVAEPNGAAPRSWSLLSAERLLQLDWAPRDDTLLFADEIGLAALRLETGAIERLASGVHAFAVDHGGEAVLVVTADGLRRIDLGGDELAAPMVEPFGPQNIRFASVDVCCSGLTTDSQ